MKSKKDRIKRHNKHKYISANLTKLAALRVTTASLKVTTASLRLATASLRPPQVTQIPLADFAPEQSSQQDIYCVENWTTANS